jgi:peptidoglycan/xylan/chitin deacetylase (PgdA/CDA1 family)
MTKLKQWIVGGFFLTLFSPSFAAETQSHGCQTMAHKGTVALTFDDGPSKKYTKKILMILEHYHIQATFFVLGNQVKKNPEYLKQMIKDGDVIGDHSMTHPIFTKLSSDQWANEVINSKKIIHDVIGEDPKVFRFPYGASNDQLKKYIQEQNMQPIFWGYTPSDYRRPGAMVIANRVVRNVRSGQIILLHDGPSKRDQTVAALPYIIRGIQKKGLGFSVLCT